MSPRNPDDMPAQQQKRMPTGMFIGCGIGALIALALGIWLITQIIGTVIDGTGANDPEDTTDTAGVQTSTMAPDESYENGTENTGSVPLPQANSDAAAGNASADALAEADTSSAGTDDAPSVVYVTETVSAQQP